MLRRTLARVQARLSELGHSSPAGTDILIHELLAGATDLHPILQHHGIELSNLLAELDEACSTLARPLIPTFDELKFQDETGHFDCYRILDASANRAREGLRVLEDYVRFACDDRMLTAEFKRIRHQLKEALSQLPRLRLLTARDTEQDVGTELATSNEWSRENLLDVVAANFKRTQEALRSLEEFGKVESRAMAEAIEAARYKLYTLERIILVGAESRTRLDGVVLYVLVSSELCSGGIEWTISEAVAGGAQVIQLREKNLADRELLTVARRVRSITRDAGVLFIMNDRPDLARLAHADGVHIGQEELAVKDARRVVGGDALVGFSTHSIEQARQAVLDGANYIGVGPTFPSETKPFDQFPGLEFVRQVQAEIRIPFFVIGGLNLQNLHKVLETGAERVAVSSAICTAESPREVSAEFRRTLEAKP